MRIFVYGTLKKSFSAHHLIARGSTKFVCEARTTEDYAIYDLGGFPGMMTSDPVGEGVQGEVYECDEQTIRGLDIYECVDQGLFERKQIELADGTIAQAYLFAGLNQLNASRLVRIIESGVWTGNV